MISYDKRIYLQLNVKIATKCNNMDNAIQCISIDNGRSSDAFEFILIFFISFPIFFK